MGRISAPTRLQTRPREAPVETAGPRHPAHDRQVGRPLIPVCPALCHDSRVAHPKSAGIERTRVNTLPVEFPSYSPGREGVKRASPPGSHSPMEGLGAGSGPERRRKRTRKTHAAKRRGAAPQASEPRNVWARSRRLHLTRSGVDGGSVQEAAAPETGIRACADTPIHPIVTG